MLSNQQDKPSFFHQEKMKKQRLLTVLKAKVVLLRKQLEAAENECNILEAELAQNLSPITYPRASIHDLPTETLIEIFALSILEHHQDIGNLLFICKQWNAIVMSSPDLWDTISLVFTLEKEDLDKELAYCTACIERSGDKFLSASISAEKESLDPWHSEIDACVESLWKSFKIHDEAFLKRYKSLYILLPTSSINYYILPFLFTRHFPNLSCLSLPEFNSDDTFRQFLIKTPLKIFTMRNGITIPNLGPSLNALQVLDCYICFNIESLLSIPSLESLTLRKHGPWPRLGNIILLPRLRALTLVGLWPEDSLSELKLPALSRLTFATHDNPDFSTKLNAEPLEFYWELASQTTSPTIDQNFVSNIGKLLSHYDSIKTMRVPSYASNFVLGAFKNLANQRVVSVELLGMRVLDDNSVLLEIDILAGSS